MEEVKILYNLESYQRENGSISDFGELYLQSGDYYFPEEHWTDFGCGAVYTWAEEFIKLIQGNEVKVECNFFDGAFLYYVEKVDKHTWKLSFIDEDKSENAEKECLVEAFELSEELLKTVKFMTDIRIKQNNIEAVEKYKVRENQLQEAINELKTF